MRYRRIRKLRRRNQRRGRVRDSPASGLEGLTDALHEHSYFWPITLDAGLALSLFRRFLITVNGVSLLVLGVLLDLTAITLPGIPKRKILADM